MDITGTLIQEIGLQCQNKGFVIPPSLAAFLTKSLNIAEQQDDTGAIELSPKTIEKIVDDAVEWLTQTDSPSLDVYKMQAEIFAQQQDNVNTSRTEAVQQKAKSQQLLQEVCSKVDHNKVFGDMVLYILHETGLFNSKSELVQRETMTALESVIPRASIESFISQHDSEKMKQLDELWKIVWGIRLFNRETNKGGAGIQDVPGDLASMIQQSQAILAQQRDATTKTIENYQKVLRYIPLQLEPPQRVRLHEEYVNRCQYLQFLDRILATVNELASSMAVLHPSYDQLVTTVREMVTNSNSVPKSVIYPQFIEVSEKWSRFTKLLGDMKETNKLIEILMAHQSAYSQTLKPSMVEEANKVYETVDKTPVNTLLLEQEINNNTHQHGCFYTAILPPSTYAMHNDYCLPSLTDQGLLLRGDASVGFVRFNGAYYSFATGEAVKAFVADPIKYVDELLSVPLIINCGLINLLDLQKCLPKHIYLQGTRQKQQIMVEVMKCDADTQTGQIDPYKDYKYEWNEWELRRLALKLADLRNKRTHSCQTNLSHFKRDNDCQTYPQKETACQTAVDKATQPPHTVQYIAGLRGNTDSQTRVIKMTFDE
eukprot:TRINITY_DN61316_c0_g2_i1.p1 TRINITY_DN61316_c0_g2~~TRINITY_DN61316_c0_g2_i1.p1  ORF type:complete len:598 (+),score=53.55 TRINITY_DN61316_c0_g2_i1:48-1841(+)